MFRRYQLRVCKPLLPMATLLLAAIVAAVLLTSGCSPDPKKARHDLEMAGYSWNVVDFVAAIEQNDIEIVKQYLEAEMSPNVESGGLSVLSHAVKHGHVELIQLLLDAGAKPSTFMAAKIGNLELVQEMLNRGADPVGASIAATNGHVEVVRLLLSRGDTVLDTRGASANGHVDALALLLDAGANPKGLRSAIEGGHREAANLLLQGGAEPVFLSNVVELGWTDVAKLMLKKGADPNSARFSNEQSLAVAAEEGNIEMVKLLLSFGADVNSRALYVAAYHGHRGIVELLLSEGAHLQGFPNFADGKYDSRIVKLFVDAKADPNTQIGSSPPIVTVLTNGDIANAKLLVDSGARLGSWGLMAMQQCANAGMNDCITFLIDSGIPTQDAVREAAKGKRVSTVEYLLKLGAAPLGLEQAVRNESAEIVNLLLQAGVDPNQDWNSGRAPILQLAYNLRNKEIIELLKTAGAKDT